MIKKTWVDAITGDSSTSTPILDIWRSPDSKDEGAVVQSSLQGHRIICLSVLGQVNKSPHPDGVEIRRSLTRSDSSRQENIHHKY